MMITLPQFSPLHFYACGSAGMNFLGSLLIAAVVAQLLPWCGVIPL